VCGGSAWVVCVVEARSCTCGGVVRLCGCVHVWLSRAVDVHEWWSRVVVRAWWIPAVVRLCAYGGVVRLCARGGVVWSVVWSCVCGGVMRLRARVCVVESCGSVVSRKWWTRAAVWSAHVVL